MTTTRFDAGAFLTPANALTIGRIALSPLLFALVLAADEHHGASWPAFVLGFAFAVSDNMDGKLARRHGTTRSGAFLDPLADKVVVLGTMFCLVAVGRYWWLPVAVVTVREVGISIWRTYWARRGLAVPARRSAKYKTLVQGIALLLAVMPTLEDHTVPVAIALWIAVGFTVVSGLQYVRDGAKATSATGSRP